MLHGTLVIIGGRTPENVCRSKPAFRSRRAVREKIKYIRSSGGPRFQYYRCSVCGRYHLTTRQEGSNS